MEYARAKLLNALRRGTRLAASAAGVRFLSKAQTVDYLRPQVLRQYPGQQLALPAVPDAVASSQLLHEARTIVTEPQYTWQLAAAAGAALLRNGGVRVGRTILCPDYAIHELGRHCWRPAPPRAATADILLAPFSHYQHPLQIWGYYDYLLLVGAKLCRLLAALPATAAAQALVSYPLFHTTYEQELAAALGLGPAQLVDSRTHRVGFSTCVLGNGAGGYYPSATDVHLLHDRLAPLINPNASSAPRLYISRRGRRRISNEDALVRMLLTYGFTVVEDRPRSLAEQLTLYHGASFILGPHGASFTNIIWCRPGTQLFEIFSPGYAPDYFHYLAQLRGVRYAGCRQALAPGRYSHPLDENIVVSVDAIERALGPLLCTT
ncbi:glycosyltransferase family 61 protein [Hymenobacter sp. RP-2-7]|uniref:Glycosyltransferase family 61 protein n=1 Tax=Hymenobacter polaris TaxID=2682546 RepID=A0A7Y0ABK5_9BACT|nr:glycosyltransferase family 61 protein [Hymenobacter polaris]NML64374.1 glycosyltransferase family 61 protein [Hymenobacter polaris]